MIVSLTETKSFLRVDHDDEDADLLLIIAAAEDAVGQHLNRSLTSWGEHGSPVGSPSIGVPEAVRQAIKMIVGDIYRNRESNIVGTIVAINPTVQLLLGPYRVCMGV